MHNLIVKIQAWFGNIEAETYMGKQYLDALDRKNALKWFSKAANKGGASAFTGLGICAYLDGDFHKALECYMKANDLGDAEAGFLIGQLYYLGEGVQIDYKTAFMYYKESAKRGFPEAIHMLAWCFEQGVGVGKNVLRALELWREAAALGVHEAIDALTKYDKSENKGRE